MQNINQSANASGLSSAGAVPCNFELSKDELISILLTALRRCKTSAEDGNQPPSARLELVRDYATPAIVAAERAAMAEWRQFWLAQAPELEPAALDAAAAAMVNCEKTAIPERALRRLRAKVAGLRPLKRVALLVNSDYEANSKPPAHPFTPLVNGGDYRGTICCVCGKPAGEHLGQ